MGDREEGKRPFGIAIWFFKRLAELCVPLNWTNDDKLYESFRILSLPQWIVPDKIRTFMNEFLGYMPTNLEFCNLITPITLLLDAGAEFANLSISQGSLRLQFLAIRMTTIASSAEFVDCKFDSVRLFSLC